MACETEEAVYLAAEADLLEAEAEAELAIMVRQQAYTNWYVAMNDYYYCLSQQGGNNRIDLSFDGAPAEWTDKQRTEVARTVGLYNSGDQPRIERFRKQLDRLRKRLGK